jgi:replicative superfamily II helicase
MAAKYLFSMPTTKPYTEELIIRSFSDILPLDRLMDNGMIYTVAEKYRCTELGHIAASMYLHPLTILFIKNAFKKLHTEDELELELMINIAIKALIVETGERPRLANQAAVEKALIEWVNEMPEEDILRARSIDAGDFHELTEEVARMSSAASITARLLGLAKLSRTFSVVSKRVRHGIKEDLIPLIDLSIPSLGRKLLRKLYDLGYLDLKELARAPAEELLGLAKLPEDAVSMIKEYTKRLAPSLSLR